MNFMFEWQEQYLTSERSERVRYCSCHENIKFISSSQRVMLFLLYGETNSTKAKGGNRDVIERYDTHKGDHPRRSGISTISSFHKSANSGTVRKQ